MRRLWVPWLAFVCALWLGCAPSPKPEPIPVPIPTPTPTPEPTPPPSPSGSISEEKFLSIPDGTTSVDVALMLGEPYRKTRVAGGYLTLVYRISRPDGSLSFGEYVFQDDKVIGRNVW